MSLPSAPCSSKQVFHRRTSAGENWETLDTAGRGDVQRAFWQRRASSRVQVSAARRRTSDLGWSAGALGERACELTVARVCAGGLGQAPDARGDETMSVGLRDATEDC